MLVDLKVTSKTKFQKGDLLICNDNGVFEPIGKQELLRENNRKIQNMEREIEQMKRFLRTYQENMTKFLKGVIDNG